MAGNEEKVGKKDEGTLLYNRGRREYLLAAGKDGSPRVLGPGQAMEVTVAEAKLLLGNKDIIEASKFVKPGRELERALVKIQKLEAENAELSVLVSKLEAHVEKVEKAKK